MHQICVLDFDSSVVLWFLYMLLGRKRKKKEKNKNYYMSKCFCVRFDVFKCKVVGVSVFIVVWWLAFRFIRGWMICVSSLYNLNNLHGWRGPRYNSPCYNYPSWLTPITTVLNAAHLFVKIQTQKKVKKNAVYWDKIVFFLTFYVFGPCF